MILTWSKNCFRSHAVANQDTTFAITDWKVYIPVLNLSTIENKTLLQQLKSGLKRTTDWNKHLLKTVRSTKKKFLINKLKMI